MNAITSFRLCKLSTHELISKIDEQTDNIFKKQKIPTRHIPARPDVGSPFLVQVKSRIFFHCCLFYQAIGRSVAKA